MKHFFSMTFLLVLVLNSALAPFVAVAESPASKLRLALEDSRQHVKKLEEQHATEEKLFKQKVSTAGSVDRALISLAKARHDLALHEMVFDESKLAVVKEQNRVVLAVRERELERLKKAKRPTPEIKEGQRRLAVARYMVAQMEKETEVAAEQLRFIIQLCFEDLAKIDKAGPKVVTAAERTRFETRLICAEYLLAVADGQAKDLIPRLRDVATSNEAEWQKTDALFRRKSATIVEEYIAFKRLIDAQLRVANLEKEHDVMRNLLTRLVEKQEATISLLDVKDKDHDMVRELRAEAARDFIRLKTVREGGPLDVLAVPELD